MRSHQDLVITFSYLQYTQNQFLLSLHNVCCICLCLYVSVCAQKRCLIFRSCKKYIFVFVVHICVRPICLQPVLVVVIGIILRPTSKILKCAKLVYTKIYDKHNNDNKRKIVNLICFMDTDNLSFLHPTFVTGMNGIRTKCAAKLKNVNMRVIDMVKV